MQVQIKSGVWVATGQQLFVPYNEQLTIFDIDIADLDSSIYDFIPLTAPLTTKNDFVLKASEVTRRANIVTAIGSLKTTAQSCVGVALTALTAAQVRSLLAILLYNAGGVDAATLKVNPLNQWVK